MCVQDWEIPEEKVIYREMAGRGAFGTRVQG